MSVAAASRVAVQVMSSAETVASRGADRLGKLLREKPEAVIAWPTGRTPVPFYDELARRHARGALDLGRVRGFNLDELVLPGDDPRSFRSFMRRHAWGRTGLREERCDIPNGAAADLEAECRRYEAAIEAAGGLDLAILGLGTDGHVAYNMPGPMSYATHVVRLPDGLAASLDLPPEAWPLRALTMGLGTIGAARRILVLATGSSKAPAVSALVHGPEDPEWPCSLLGSHHDIEAVVDEPAAALLH